MKFSLPRNYPTGEGAVVLVPADRFVVRCVPVDLANEVTEQVELAIESFTPLPLAQLYWGYLRDPVRPCVLIWMACRKHFKPEEIARWDSAGAVLPASLLLGRRQGACGFTLHRSESHLQAATWTGEGDLPTVLIARAVGFSTEEDIIGEVQRRSGQPPGEVRCLDGLIEPRVLAKGSGFEIRCGDFSATYSWSELETADIRDRDGLKTIQRGISQGALLWRASVVAAVLVVAAAGIDLARVAAGFGLGRLEAGVRERTAAVSEIQSAHVLAHRLEELSRQRLRFMEMLDVLNEHRPAGLLFLHVESHGPRGLEVVARTLNADEARQFEAALRSATELSSIAMGNLSTRDGHTDFTLRAEFREEAFTADLGMP